MKSFLKLFLYGLLIALGIFMFIYGEYDDSPGGQLLGIVMATSGAIGVIKRCRRKNSTK